MNGLAFTPRVNCARRVLAPLAFALVVAVTVLAAARPAFALDHPADGDRVQAAIPVPALRPGFPVSTGGTPFSQPPVIVDLDFDGKSEIVAIDNNGRLKCVLGDGSPFGGFSRDLGAAPSGPLAVGDVDNDGFLEIVAVGTNGEVRVFSNEGALESVALHVDAAPVGGAMLTPLDRSGQLAIVVAFANGMMYAVHADGTPFPGWPVSASAAAVSSPFAYVGPDNFPRVGYLGASPDRAQVFFTYGARDTEASIEFGDSFSGATPVAGARELFGLPDGDHLYVMSRHGLLRRVDPNPVTGNSTTTVLNGLPNDSVFVQPSLVDVSGDLVPELAVLSMRGDTLSVWLLDGANGLPLAGFPRRYIQPSLVGGIVCADVGDNNAAELIFNRGGNKVTCVRSTGTEAWTLDFLPSVSSPAIGDLDNDGGLDVVVATTTGELYAYTMGNAGLGPRTIEWGNAGGSPSHEGRHLLRDRATLRPFWPPPITPENTFTARPVIGNFDDDRPDVLWSDYATGKTFGFNTGGGAMPGLPQEYAKGQISDAPAIGDITGDGRFETVQATDQGWIVWGDKTGTKGSFLVDNNRVLTPPSLADLNNDGILDVVVGSSSGRLYGVKVSGTPAILPGFPVTTAGAIALPAALGDVNGDGSTDIVVVAAARNLVAYPRTGVTPLTGWPRTYTLGNTLTQPILVPVAGQSGLCVAFGRTTGVDSVAAHLVGANGAPLAGWPKRLNGASNLIYGPVAGDFDNDGAVDLVFSTGGDSVMVFNAAGNRPVPARRFASPGNVEVCAMVDLDLDLRPDIVAVSDLSTLLGIRFNGITVRSFTRMLITLEAGVPPVFGDLGNDGILDMAASDLGQPLVYSWGYGSWNALASPWPMKGHDRYRTNAYSGLTVVGVGDPEAAGPPARGTGIARAVPNPARGAVVFTHTRALAGAYEAAIFDVRGRLVRELGRGDAPALGQAMTWTWDGRDEAGASAPAGIYFYQVRDAAGTMREKVVRLR